MRPSFHRAIVVIAGFIFSAGTLMSQSKEPRQPNLPIEEIASKNFGNDAPWFLRNIPFLEIDDPEIQQVYYYRWKLYRSHIREIGPQGTTVLEFLPNVPWARQPYTDLNDSASFHITEGRWLRDPTTVDSLIDHLYSGGGNDRHFSESIAAATEASTLVTGDPVPALRHLDTMRYIYNEWDDHFDRARNLYWIEPLLDATEYTIASIDASGAGFTDKPSTDQNRNGFTGGLTFRPSINSYQYANALAISRLASQAGKPDVAEDYAQRAVSIRSAVLSQLWNPTLEHFTDRYQRSTPYVTAGEFIRGRELVGYVPWLYELAPQDSPDAGKYDVAWEHALAATELGGPFGLRTVEPTYPRYLNQYRYDQASGKPECQWNGPSWPFQTSQALAAMANLLDDYPSSKVTKADYLHLLRQYTKEHFISPGYPDLQEDYDPDTGRPIVGLARSHHYSHSTYVDLVLSGLIGIRPRTDNILEIDPLISSQVHPGEQPIRYFTLQNVEYHGHNIGIVYDENGARYGIGRGLSVFVDGNRLFGPKPLGRVHVPLPPLSRPLTHASEPRIDLCVNPGLPSGPLAAASSSITPAAIAEAIDGRLWFFPEIANGWSPNADSAEPTSWYTVDLQQSNTIGSVELYFFADGAKYLVPPRFDLQYLTSGGWRDIPQQQRHPREPLANGENEITFPPLSTQKLRLVVTNPPAPSTFRLVEIKAFAPPRRR